MSATDNQSAIVERTKEICEEFDSRVAVVGLPFARLELAKALAQSEDALRAAVADVDAARADYEGLRAMLKCPDDSDLASWIDTLLNERDAAIARERAEEQEACAEKCRAISAKDAIWRYEVRIGAELCESAIRARGEAKCDAY